MLPGGNSAVLTEGSDALRRGSGYGESMNETSPGGSTIRRYARWMMPKIGVPDEPTEEYAKQREAVYSELFGEAVNVYHELVPMVPHIDVFTYHRELDGKQTTVLVTGGMSDVRMRLPLGIDSSQASPRAELIFYCDGEAAEYLPVMRSLARFPHDNKTWIYFGHTIPNGNPPAPFWGSSILDTVLLMPTIVKRDSELPERLQLGGDPVNFLWVVPLSPAECQLKLEKGFHAILDLFGRHKHPYVYNPARQSYV
jgi:hypothetical protein